MNKLVLSILSVMTVGALTSTVQAHDQCYRSDYGYRQSYGYYQPPVRVYHVERPVYYRSYDRYSDRDSRYDDRRCETRSHHGVRGFFGRLFR